LARHHFYLHLSVAWPQYPAPSLQVEAVNSNRTRCARISNNRRATVCAETGGMRVRPRRAGLSCALLAAALVLLVLPAQAASPAEPDGEWTVNGIEEDDYFAPHNKDEHYTQGLRISATSPDVTADWTWPFTQFAWAFPVDARYQQDVTRRHNLAVGQNMYTPQNRFLVIPNPRDRPYAGWLYAGVGLMQDSGGVEFEEFDLKLGIVGPSSMARETQTDWHLNVVGTRPFVGWASQLRNEPALDLYYDRKWRLLHGDLDGGNWGWDAIPQASIRIGNVYDYLGGGGMLRIGRNLMIDYGPPHIDLNTGSDYINPTRGDGGLGFYVFLGTEARLVVRNIFLDGNSFESSAHVTKNPAVADGELGVAVTRGHFRFSYTLVYRTPEFVTQEGADHYGSLNLTFHCSFEHCFD
jgi:lipid A 3-O-deacylase